jgi:RHS repeat-associated protein
LSYDHLGSVRLVTDQNANVVARHDYLPFGEEIPANTAGRNSQWGLTADVEQKFTGQIRDNETGMDYFNARYLTGALGRFNSSDPLNLGADATDPQTWNGYAYVRNNPLALVDPMGLCTFDAEGNAVEDENGACYEGGFGGSVTVTASPPPDVMPIFVSLPSLLSDTQQPMQSAPPAVTETGVAVQSPNSWIGIRTPGQSFRSCMQQHANDYNIGGSVELLADLAFNGGIGTSYSSNPIVSFFTGNAITSLAFGSAADASSVAANAAPGIVRAGMGAVTTYGRRTSKIMSLNIPPLDGRAPGGLPQGLGQPGASAVLRRALSRISDAFSLGLKASTRWALDAAFTGAEMVNCSMTY